MIRGLSSDGVDIGSDGIGIGSDGIGIGFRMFGSWFHDSGELGFLKFADGLV